MKKKILLVDDVKLFLKLEETFFKRTGCEILMAESGEQALTSATANSPDLILLDYIMPDMMGDEVCRRLKASETTRSIPVIIVSTSADPGDMQKCFNAGASEYVTKPINPQEVLSKAAGLLAIPHRIHVRQPVRFKVVGEAHGKTFTGYTRNISRGGLLLDCTDNIAVGAELSLELPIRAEQQSLNVQAHVVRCDHDPTKGDYSLGVQFREMSAEARADIENFIARSTMAKF